MLFFAVLSVFSTAVLLFFPAAVLLFSRCCFHFCFIAFSTAVLLLFQLLLSLLFYYFFSYCFHFRFIAFSAAVSHGKELGKNCETALATDKILSLHFLSVEFASFFLGKSFKPQISCYFSNHLSVFLDYSSLVSSGFSSTNTD